MPFEKIKFFVCYSCKVSKIGLKSYVVTILGQEVRFLMLFWVCCHV